MKILKFAICDDIRLEKDDKISLMGLYEEEIFLKVAPSNKGKWPKRFSFSILLRMQIEEKDIQAGMTSVGVTLNLNGKEQKILKIDLTPKHLGKRKKIGLLPKVDNFPINSEGNLTFKVSLFDKDGKEVESLKTPSTKIVESVIDNL